MILYKLKKKLKFKKTSVCIDKSQNSKTQKHKA